MVSESPQDKLARVLKGKRLVSDLSPNSVGDATKNLQKNFKVSQSFLWEIEHKSRVPSPLKPLTLVRFYSPTLSEIDKTMGATDEEICECHKTLPADARESGAVTDFLEVLRSGDRLAIENVKGAIKIAIRGKNQSKLCASGSRLGY